VILIIFHKKEENMGADMFELFLQEVNLMQGTCPEERVISEEVIEIEEGREGGNSQFYRIDDNSFEQLFHKTKECREEFLKCSRTSSSIGFLKTIWDEAALQAASNVKTKGEKKQLLAYASSEIMEQILSATKHV
jgi:hypothetical protein